MSELWFCGFALDDATLQERCLNGDELFDAAALRVRIERC